MENDARTRFVNTLSDAMHKVLRLSIEMAAFPAENSTKKRFHSESAAASSAIHSLMMFSPNCSWCWV